MRKYFILFFVCIFLLVMTVVMLFLLNPFDTEAIFELARSENITASEELRVVIQELLQRGLLWEFLNLRSLLIITGLAAGSMISGFAFLHMALDKLFFRRFFEQTSVVVALRRGVIFAALLIGLFYLNLIGTQWYIAISYIIVVVGVEFVFSRVTAKPPEIMEDYVQEADVLQKQKFVPLHKRIWFKVRDQLRGAGAAVGGAYKSTRARISGDSQVVVSSQHDVEQVTENDARGS